MFVAFRKCPLFYYEKYEVHEDGLHSDGEFGIELCAPKPDRDFGTRFHQLLHIERAAGLVHCATGGTGYNAGGLPEYPAWPDDAIESECQSVLAAYLAHYPVEPLTFLSAERTEVVRVSGTAHELVVKMDGVVRFPDGSIGPLDTKTERANSSYNEREAWAARSQASFYLWATQQLYPNEKVTRLVVDVVTRGNSKRQPSFRRMDDIARTPEQLDESIRNLIEVADEIEYRRKTGWWPRNDNMCKDGWRRCDYYDLHIIGRTEANLKLYKPAERYLDI